MENVIYNILTILIVAFAFFLLGRKVYNSFANNSNACDSGCDGCASKCDLKEIMQKQNNAL